MKPMKKQIGSTSDPNSNQEERKKKKMNTPTTQWIQNRSIKMNKHNACTLRPLD